MSRTQRPFAALVVVCVATALLPALARAGDVRVSRTIDFAKTAVVRDAVKEQCELQTRIPAEIAKNHDGVALVDGRGDLQLQITDVHAPGGWIFSGPKWLEVRGTLHMGGKELPFRAKRYSAFDPFAGGTCGILAKCARGIGKDIALWLAAPEAGAELGDAQ